MSDSATSSSRLTGFIQRHFTPWRLIVLLATVLTVCVLCLAVGPWATFNRHRRIDALRGSVQRSASNPGKLVRLLTWAGFDDVAHTIEPITGLSLDGQTLTINQWRDIQTLPSLKSLIFMSCQIPPRAVVGNVRSDETLQQILIENSDVADSWFHGIDRLTALELLSVRNCPISDRAATDIGNVSTLHVLHLEGTKVTQPGRAIVGSRSSLEHLAFDDSPIDNTGPFDIGVLPQLESLGLHGTKTSDIGLSAVTAPRLRELYVDRTQVECKSVRLSQQFPQLKILEASDCPIGDEGLADLVSLRYLRTLRLRNTRVTGSAFGASGDLRELKILLLNGSPISTEGMRQIGQLKSVRVIYLENTGVSDEGLDLLTGTTELRKLYLSGNVRVTDRAVDILLRLKNLEDVYLLGTKVTPAGVERLKQGGIIGFID